jgi:hypothetical protein
MNIIEILIYAFLSFVFIQAIVEMAAMKAETRIIRDFIKFFEENSKGIEIELQEEKKSV